jgi:two-component system LytT family response regulator
VLLQADGAYTKVHLKDKKNILVSKKLKYFEILLEERSQFYRIHRSTIININYIRKYSKSDNCICLDDGTTVNISKDRKRNFEAHIQSIRL